MEREIHVRMRTGEESITLKVKESDTIQNVKNKIEHMEGFSTDSQELLFAGDKLEDQHTLSHYKITERSTLILNKDHGKCILLLYL